MKHLFFTPALFLFSYSSFAWVTQDCLDTINTITKKNYDLQDYKCSSKNLFFDDVEIPTISCSDAKGTLFSQPKRDEASGQYIQKVETKDSSLSVFYDSKGKLLRMETRKSGSFSDDFFASNIEFNNYGNKCFVHRYYSGVPSKTRGINFDTVACAEWVDYNKNNPSLNKCLDDFTAVSKLHNKHFGADFTKGSTFLDSSVNKIRSYISQMDQNCADAEHKWGAKASVESAISLMEQHKEIPMGQGTKELQNPSQIIAE